jgi:RNA ligase
MGYQKICNLYRFPDYLRIFKEVHVLEKIDGTSSHLEIHTTPDDGCNISLFHGGGDKYTFRNLFDLDKIKDIYLNSEIECDGGFKKRFFGKHITLYGEFFGGKIQGLSKTYGTAGAFVVFDVKLRNALLGDVNSNNWMDVDAAERTAKAFGLDFVWHTVCENTIENLNKYRDQPSQEGIRRGCGERKAEGIVTKPLVTVYDCNGGRYVFKHKRDDNRETKSTREVDPSRELEVFKGQAVADEFVTKERLRHILDKGGWTTLQDIPAVIAAMQNDIALECSGEYIPSKFVDKAIGGRTVTLYREHLNERLK